MKAHALVPALALAAALLVPPLAEAGHRHGPGCGHRPPAHGTYGQRPAPYYGHGHGHAYRAPRHYRGYRRYAPPPPYYGSGSGYGYGYGYGGYNGGYYGSGPGYYPPPPPAYCPPRPRGGVGIWFGF